MASEKNDDIELMKSLRVGMVVFFAGAGISMGSGLPRAMGLIVPVALHYFPTKRVVIPPPNPDDPLDKWKVELKEREDAPGKDSPLVFGRDILPEELYSILLEHLPERDRAACVGMFGCLRPNKRHGYFPKPNFVHCFIVLYSYVHDVPVFTVNFDPMFELACEQQGLPYRAYTFRDMDAYEKDCAGDGDRAVRICKVHGSVGLSDDESFEHRMIKTTAEAISNDDGWADLITGLMGDHDLAFAGYSGRDVDFYPAIRSAALREGKARAVEGSPGYGYRPLFWFDSFEEDHVNENEKAEQCEASKVCGYPNKVLPGCLLDDPEIIPCANENLLARRNELVAQAQESLAKAEDSEKSKASGEDDASRLKAPWLKVSEKYESAFPPINEDVLYLETLVHWQRNLSAKRFLRENGKQIAEAVQREKGDLVWLQRQEVRVCREVGNMRAYTLGAWRLVTKVPKHSCWSEDSVHARLELVSSLQMRIPSFDTSVVKYAWWEAALMAPFALVTEAAFWLLRRRVIGRGLLGEDGAVAGISAVGELENRHLALEFRMVDALPVSARRKESLREPLRKRLLVLGDVARKKGLHATVKGVVRRVDRIGLAEVARDDADREGLTKDDSANTTIPADAICKGLASDATADDVRKGLEAFFELHSVFYGVFPDVSQKTNMDRERSNLEDAIAAYRISRVCGNTLGDLKSLVTIVSRALGEDGDSGLSEDHRRYLDELRRLIGDRDRCESLNLLNRAHVKRFLREVDRRLAH